MMMISNNKVSGKTTHKHSRRCSFFLCADYTLLSNNFVVDAQVNGKMVTAHIISNIFYEL